MKEVALIYDISGWAWHRMCLGIKEYADNANVEALSPYQWGEGLARDKQAWVNRWDGVLICSWPEGDTPGIKYRDMKRAGAPRYHWRMRRGVAINASHGCLYDDNDSRDWNTNVVTTLRNTKRARDRFPEYDGVICTSRQLYDRCVGKFPDATFTYLPAGVDHMLFNPRKRRVDSGQHVIAKELKRMRVGWCANIGGDRSVKGFRAMRLAEHQLLDECEFSVNTALPPGKWNAAEMQKWYCSLDVFLCTSINEGSPLTVFEAAACGCAVLSTPVGAVPELKQDRIMLPAYSDTNSETNCIDVIVKTLKSWRHNRVALKLQQKFDLEASRNFYWCGLADKWIDFITKGQPNEN